MSSHDGTLDKNHSVYPSPTSTMVPASGLVLPTGIADTGTVISAPFGAMMLNR